VVRLGAVVLVRVGVFGSGGALSQAQPARQTLPAISAQLSSQKSAQQKSSTPQTQSSHTGSEHPGPSSESRPLQQLLAGPGEPEGVGVVGVGEVAIPHWQRSMQSVLAKPAQLVSQTSSQQKSSRSHTQLSHPKTSQPLPSS
jgi:hypothetical protein